MAALPGAVVGLTEAQRRALAVTHRRAKTTELRARTHAQWTLESMGNKVKQKHFKVGSICRSGICIDPTMFGPIDQPDVPGRING